MIGLNANALIVTAPSTGGGGTGDAVCWDVVQVAHGLAAGEPVYLTTPGGVYTKAKADVGATVALLLVSAVAGVDDFTVCQVGRVTLNAHGLTVGETYYVSAATAGLLTVDEPDPGVSNPMVLVLDANTLLVTPFRPSPM